MRVFIPNVAACVESRATRAACVLLVTMLLVGCRTGLNYTAPQTPRYSGYGDSTRSAAPHGDTIRVASFNIKYGIAIDSAIALLRGDSMLRDADIILLQEMDNDGTRRIAQRFGYWYVYYPAMLRSNIKREWGNAVLSRWPIIADAKIILPHIGTFGRTQRTATGATIRIGDQLVRVYSVHLGTVANVSGGARRDQLRAVLADAAQYPRVIIGGDMNSHSVGTTARDAGYLWPTEHGPHTVGPGRWDHVFLKGLTLPAARASGTVLNVRHASDHRPIWVQVLVAAP